jgi:tetratricopeptide (TPR) repeat protein
MEVKGHLGGLKQRLIASTMLAFSTCTLPGLPLAPHQQLDSWTKLRLEGYARSRRGDKEGALQSFQQALEMCKSMGSRTSMYRAISLRELAAFLLEQRQFKQSLQLLKEERPLVEPLPSSPLALDCLHMAVRAAAGADDEAYAKSCLKDLEDNWGYQEIFVRSAGEEIVELYRRKGQTDKQISLLQRLLAETAKISDEFDTKRFELELHLAQCFERQRKLDQSLQHYIICVRASMVSPEMFEQITKPALTGACTIYHMQHKDDQAQSLYTEVLSKMEKHLSEQKVYLYRRLFDTMLYYGSSHADYQKARDLPAALRAVARKTRDKRLMVEADHQWSTIMTIEGKNPNRK